MVTLNITMENEKGTFMILKSLLSPFSLPRFAGLPIEVTIYQRGKRFQEPLLLVKLQKRFLRSEERRVGKECRL